LLDHLLFWDYKLFHIIHVQLQSIVLDSVLPFIRNKYFWGPLYLFFAVHAYEKFGNKGIMWMIYFLVAFGLTDFICASVLKPLIHRVRPCNDVMWYDVHRHIVPISSGFSFPSNHAANHFALATFISISCKAYYPRLKSFVYFWAFLIAFAQVYVGVHYPIDVIGGAILGIWLGYIVGNYFNFKYAYDH
jgi:membrane-associated phospholipid phosphatase